MPRRHFHEVDALSRCKPLIARGSIRSALATYLVVVAVTAIALLCGGREEPREEAGVGAGSFPIGNEVSGVSAAEHDGTSVLASLRVVPMLRQHRPAADRDPSASCLAPEPWALHNTPQGVAVDWSDDTSLPRDAGRAAHQPRAPPHMV